MSPRAFLPLLAAALAPFAGHALDETFRANRTGLEHYAAGRFGEAQAAFQAGLETPEATAAETAVLAYNEGLALVRQDSFENALDRFRRALASPDASLRARAAYAAGNVHVRQGEAGGQDEESLRKAIGHMEAAQESYEQALESSPDMTDAAANHELAQARAAEFRKKLEELEKQKQQQQEQQKQDKEKQDSPKQEPQKDPANPDKPSQPKDPQPSNSGDAPKPQPPDGQPPKPDPSNAGKPDRPKDPQNGKDPQSQGNDPKEGNPEGQGGKGQGQAGKNQDTDAGKDPADAAQSGQGQPKPGDMTPEQARMLLNAMLSDEKQQREAVRLFRMKAAPDIPVEKDY